MRIGILSLQHESNTFIAGTTPVEAFEVNVGNDAIRARLGEAHHEVTGMLRTLDEAGVQAVPLYVAIATPSGTVEAAAADQLIGDLLDALRNAGDFDGLLVAPHGAGVAENHRDLDGYWLTRVREMVGPNMPVVCTIDPHCNLSPAMVNACNATVAYRSNPHLDQFDRGKEAANLVMKAARGEIKLTQRASFPPIAINMERQHTTSPPCLPMYEFANSLLKEDRVLSNSIVLGFPYADVDEMGTCFITVTDGEEGLAQSHCDKLANYLHEHRDEFVGQFVSVPEAVEQAIGQSGPVCLLDMGDNIGGGSPADGTFIAGYIHEHPGPQTFVSLCDPKAQRHARAAGVGATVELAMGGKTDHLHGSPIHAAVRVISLHDGTFEEPQARHGGKRYWDMGPTAIVATATGLTIQLTSKRVPPFSLNQVLSCGISPGDFQILIAKGVHAPVAAYQPVSKALIRVNTAGCTTADMRNLKYAHRRKPLFPFEAV